VDFNLDETQEQLQEAFAALFEKEASPTRVREAEPLGFDPKLWAQVVAMGGVSMGVPESSGGDGAGMVELTVVAEQLGRSLAPVPQVEAAVAARLLARVGDGVAQPWLAEALDGSGIVSLAVRPADAGVAHLAPAGAVARAMIVLRGDELVLAEAPAGGCTHRVNVGSLPLADWDVNDARVLARGHEARALFGDAVDEWKVLTAASLVGLGARAHEIGLEFVKQREAFGRPIGAFQTVAHKLADSIVRLDGARFLVYEAAWLTDQELATAPGFSAAAFAYCGETMCDIAGDSLHFHGGVGYTVEQDIQLYYRRAKGWPLVLGDPRAEYQRVADEIWGPRERAIP
jgi:alkylation response protein AidB-like acyl-CoA dehydrogenase